VLAGSEGIGGIEFDDYEVAQAVGIVALAFILFAGGFDTHWHRARPMVPRAIGLATVGVLVTAGLTGIVAYAVLDHASDGRTALVLAVAGGAVLTELTTELVPEARLLAGPIAGTAVVIGFALVFGLVEVA